MRKSPACVKNNIHVSHLRISFFFAKDLAQRNGFFTSSVVNGLLVGKSFDAISTVFSFVTAFINRATEYSKEPLLRASHVKYADVLNRL